MVYKKGQRVTLVGATGSGKTSRMIELIRQSPVSPVLIFDTKEDDAFLKCFPNAKVQEGLGPIKKNDVTIIRPAPVESSDPEILDDFLYGLHQSENVLVVIDEAYMFHRGGQAGPGLLGLITRGRSRGITMLTGSQRPAWVSRFVFTECEHFNILKLRNPGDRKIMSQYSGIDEVETEKLDFFEGIYTDGKITEKFYVKPAKPLSFSPEREYKQIKFV